MSHHDYQHYQNDGEYVKQYSQQQHSGEVDFDNDVIGSGGSLNEGDDVSKNPLDRGPYFEVTASKNITAIAGHSAYLNCRVRNLSNRTVRSFCCERGVHNS